MTRVVDVPANTAIADLDEALRTLLKRELGKHGFEGVEIAFDAPEKEWSGKLTGPTVDLFLYDLREAVERADANPVERRQNGTAVVHDPPLHLELTYAVTAWTKSVEDEHRLLSQVLGILFSFSAIPEEVIAPGARRTLVSAETSVGRPREEKADFWTSVGGSYKASIDYVVHIRIESGGAYVRGPEVRSTRVRTSLADFGRPMMEEFHNCGGTVRDADGEPLPGAWVALPDDGRMAVTDGDGRWRFMRLKTGARRVQAMTPDGQTAAAELQVPGPPCDLQVAPARTKGR